MTDGVWRLSRPTDGRQVPYRIYFDRLEARTAVKTVCAAFSKPHSLLSDTTTGVDFQSKGRATLTRPFHNFQVTSRPTAITFLILSI